MMHTRKKKAGHPMLNWIATVLLIYCGYCTLLFLFQRHMLFPRGMMPEVNLDVSTKLPSLEIIWVQTETGKAEAYWLPPKKMTSQPVPVVIFAHGNAERIEFCIEEMGVFNHWGMGVLLVEFPGYGRSEGTPSQDTITKTFMAAYDQIIQRKEVDPSKIILYGRSIGGGVVCSLSRHRPAAAMILTSTFTSVRSFAKRYLVPAFLVRDPFDNLAAVREFQEPLLILHGTRDEIIPYKHGRALYEVSNNAGFISMDCGHNDCPPDWHRFWGEIGKFLKKADLLPL